MVKRKCEIILVGVALAMTTLGVFSTPNTFADDIIDVVNVTVPTSCSFSESVSGNTEHTATMHNDEYQDDIGITNFTVFCNDKDGYSIYAVGYSEDTYGNTEMVYQGDADPAPSSIVTGTATDGSVSNWAMKLSAVTGAYTPTILNGFGVYKMVPSTYTKVATFPSQTDNTIGSTLRSTYAVFISPTQPAGTYQGKVRYTLVHPNSEVPPTPQATEAGKICYYPNGSNVEGTMGCQTIPASGETDGVSPTSAMLLASNFSRTGYGFAGWSTTHDYSDSNGFFGPQEEISYAEGAYSGTNPGLSLYAHWVESAGSLQGWTCPNNTTMPVGSVTALTDLRDNETYAVAKLADGNCWMVENLRLDDQFTTTDPNKRLAQGYGGVFNGLASPEDVTYFHTSTSPNSLYSVDDQNKNMITGDNQGVRFPRYNNTNTANRSANPVDNSGNIYSYGNYYTWAAAIADTSDYTQRNYSVSDTSICPLQWRLPKGGDRDNETNNDYWSLIVTNLNNNIYPANYNSNIEPFYTGSSEAVYVSNLLRQYPNNFVYSGYVNTNKIMNRGIYGTYYSSTGKGSVNAYSLRLDDSFVYPGTRDYGKFLGRAVRCFASPDA